MNEQIHETTIRLISVITLLVIVIPIRVHADAVNYGYLCANQLELCSQNVKITGVESVRNSNVLRVWADFTKLSPNAIPNPAGCARNTAVQLPLTTTDAMDAMTLGLMQRIIQSTYVNQLSVIFLVSGSQCSDAVILELRNGENVEVNVSFPVLVGIEVSRIRY